MAILSSAAQRITGSKRPPPRTCGAVSLAASRLSSARRYQTTGTFAPPPNLTRPRPANTLVSSTRKEDRASFAREESALRRRQEEEAFLRRRQEEEAFLRRRQEEEAFLRRRQEEEAFLRRRQEAFLRRRQEEEAALRRRQEEEAFLRIRQEEEAALRRRQEEEAVSRIGHEEAALWMRQEETPEWMGHEEQTPEWMGHEEQTPEWMGQEDETPGCTGQEDETLVLGEEEGTPVWPGQEEEAPVPTGQEEEAPVWTGHEGEAAVWMRQEEEAAVAKQHGGLMRGVELYQRESEFDERQKAEEAKLLAQEEAFKRQRELWSSHEQQQQVLQQAASHQRVPRIQAPMRQFVFHKHGACGKWQPLCPPPPQSVLIHQPDMVDRGHYEFETMRRNVSWREPTEHFMETELRRPPRGEPRAVFEAKAAPESLWEKISPHLKTFFCGKA